MEEGDVETIEILKRRLHVMTKFCILGLLTLYRACSFTTRQYEHMCAIILIANADFILPAASSLRKVKWPFICRAIFPKSETFDFSCKQTFHNPTSSFAPTRSTAFDVVSETEAPYKEETKHESGLSKKICQQDIRSVANC